MKRTVRVALILVAAMSALLSPGANVAAAATTSTPAPAQVEAYLDGVPIPVSSVPNYFCTMRAYPTIRCFGTEAARDADTEQAMRVATATSACPMVLVYQDINYGGGNSVFYTGNIPDLTTLGWNDQISSFKQYSTMQVRWYQNSNYGGTSWMWSAGAWVSNVGGAANDQFSSLTWNAGTC